MFHDVYSSGFYSVGYYFLICLWELLVLQNKSFSFLWMDCMLVGKNRYFVEVKGLTQLFGFFLTLLADNNRRSG